MALRSKLSLTMALIFLIVLAETFALGLACLNNNDACQPDGSMGNCCSGFCYKQANWNMGICATP